MLASALIEKAAVKAGLCETGSVPTVLSTMGLSDLNRWYRFVWNKYPHRDSRLADVTVSVVTGDGVVDLPTAVDGIRVVRDGNGALLPLCDATAADFSDVFLLSSGTPSRYVVLPDGVDSSTKPIRRIRLAPMPAAALTLTVSGVRRFAELAASDTVLLSRCEDALYFYVLAEMYRFAGDAVSMKEAFAAAASHLASALNFEDIAAENDTVQVPTESFYA